ncbi:MAG: hypothetical protein FJ034_01015 [Chloroflexi bacterium]|nr:hypothetical protein [Chloroflexota bacterium]
MAGIALPIGDVLLSAALLVPLAGSFGALGALAASRWPRLAIAALSVVALWSYLVPQVGPLVDVPDWLIRTSLFDLYGTPLLTGVRWGGELALIGITVGGFALAALAMRRRDVGT